jgi:hypothetical protein
MAVEKDTAELTDFEQHLEIYGSRAEKWPAAARERFEQLLANEARAKELLADAQALERLLDRAPSPNPARMQVLSDRIVALATGEAGRASAPVIIDLAARRRPRPAPPALQWKLASALAASLMFGIYIGAAPRVVSAVEAIAGAVGLPADAESSDLVLFDDGAADEEDLI